MAKERSYVMEAHCDDRFVLFPAAVDSFYYLSLAGDKILHLKLSEIVKETISTVYDSVIKVM